MQVQVNTDDSVEGREDLNREVARSLQGALHRFADRITRVEVHLSDENKGKGGELDKRCLLEARIAGREPLAVDHKAPTMQLAIDGATEKLVRALAGRLDRR